MNRPTRTAGLICAVAVSLAFVASPASADELAAASPATTPSPMTTEAQTGPPAQGEEDSQPTSCSLAYSAHVLGVGDIDASSSGYAGTTGKGEHIDTLTVSLGRESSEDVAVSVLNNGVWSSWAGDGSPAGTPDMPFEAVRVRLSDELSARYSIWYRVHSSEFGWLGWTHDGEAAGSTGYGRDVEAVEIRLVAADSDAPGPTESNFKDASAELPKVVYSAHVATVGWQGSVSFDAAVPGDVATAGTTGRSLPMEALDASISWLGHDGGIEKRAHVQDYGWQPWTTNMTGTTGRSKRMEAIELRLTGEIAQSYDIYYRVHCADYGWLGWTSNGLPAGTCGKSKGIEAIQITLVPKSGGQAPGPTDSPFIGEVESIASRGLDINGRTMVSGSDGIVGNQDANTPLRSTAFSLVNEVDEGSVQYRGYLQGSGWQDDWASDGAHLNGENDGRALQALQLKLSGDAAEKYDIWYRVFDAEKGWLGWAANGSSSGVEGLSGGLRAVQVCLLPKGSPAPGDADGALVSNETAEPTVFYRAHIANEGWQNAVTNGAQAGSTGRSLGLQALRVGVCGPVEGGVEVDAHIADIGWQGYRAVDSYAGTVGRGIPIQAVRLRLTGSLAGSYDVFYRVHASNVGWLGWAKDDEDAGTVGFGNGIEAIEIRLVKKGDEAPASDAPAALEASVTGSAHVQDHGWMGESSGTSVVIGTSGQSKRLEAFRLGLDSTVGGGISYSAHVQDIGWQAAVSDGQEAGTDGLSKRVECVKLSLTGEAAKYYDVWYRAYVQDYGWLDWTCDGNRAGTSGIGFRLEQLQVKIRLKGTDAPGPTARPFTDQPPIPADQAEMNARAQGYWSNTPWLLMVNTTTCRVGVYRGSQGAWSQFAYWQCSPGAPSTPTVLGQYTVRGKGFSFGSGYTCYYYTQFYKDYLFHSVLYYQNTYRIMDGRLGQNLSHGCVRMDINCAKWIYDNIPYGTKVVTYG